MRQIFDDEIEKRTQSNSIEARVRTVEHARTRQQIGRILAFSLFFFSFRIYFIDILLSVCVWVPIDFTENWNRSCYFYGYDFGK